jgi:IMP dehydrogenase
VIADGGIKFSGDFAKAIAAGADCAMVGSMIAGTDESPGEVVPYQGRSFKTYRGMGSLGAMARGSADRYFQKDAASERQAGARGDRGAGALQGTRRHGHPPDDRRAARGDGLYRDAPRSTTCAACSFVRITGAGLKESHVHDVQITRESPNYHSQMSMLRAFLK